MDFSKTVIVRYSYSLKYSDNVTENYAVFYSSDSIDKIHSSLTDFCSSVDQRLLSFEIVTAYPISFL